MGGEAPCSFLVQGDWNKARRYWSFDPIGCTEQAANSLSEQKRVKKSSTQQPPKATLENAFAVMNKHPTLH